MASSSSPMIRVDVTLLIDPARAGVRGYSPEQTAALFVADGLADLVEGDEDYRVLSAQALDAPAHLLWRDAPSIVYVGHPFMYCDPGPAGVGPTLLDDDGNEFHDAPGSVPVAGRTALVAHGDTDGAVYETPRRPMPNALQAGVYSDTVCPQCRNALTLVDAEAGFRLCAYCARERLHIQGRLEGLEDGTGSYVDNRTASIIELSRPFQDSRGYGATIARIHVNGPERGKGVASALLTVVCQDADAQGEMLYLQVAARVEAGGLDNEQLAAWYTRHGFEPTADRPGWMDRVPQDGA